VNNRLFKPYNSPQLLYLDNYLKCNTIELQFSVRAFDETTERTHSDARGVVWDHPIRFVGGSNRCELNSTV